MTNQYMTIVLLPPSVMALDSFGGVCSNFKICCLKSSWIYIDITAALRVVLNIARACACNILYLHEGASPRWRYFRIARRAQRARVLYDSSALEARNDIVYIHQLGRFSSVVVMPLIR